MSFLFKKITLTGGTTWDSYQIPDQVRTVTIVVEGDTKIGTSDSPADHGMIYSKASLDIDESGAMGTTFYFNGTAGQLVYITMYQKTPNR